MCQCRLPPIWLVFQRRISTELDQMDRLIRLNICCKAPGFDEPVLERPPRMGDDPANQFHTRLTYSPGVRHVQISAIRAPNPPECHQGSGRGCGCWSRKECTLQSECKRLASAWR